MYAIKQNRRAQNNNPTHRNELTHLGSVYVNSSCDLSRVDTKTIQLIKDFYTNVFLSISDNVCIMAVSQDIKPDLAVITDRYRNSEYPHIYYYNGGSNGLLGISKMVERVSHDVLHIDSEADFTLAGEYKVWWHTSQIIEKYGQSQGYDDNTIRQAISVLYSEIYLQACAYDYLGGYPSQQKIVLTHNPYNVYRAFSEVKSGLTYVNN
jgi:hypothetical protein